MPQTPKKLESPAVYCFPTDPAQTTHAHKKYESWNQVACGHAHYGQIAHRTPFDSEKSLSRASPINRCFYSGVRQQGIPFNIPNTSTTIDGTLVLTDLGMIAVCSAPENLKQEYFKPSVRPAARARKSALFARRAPFSGTGT